MTESFRRAPTVEITQSLLSTVPASESLLEIVLCRSNCLMLGWPDLEDSFPNCCKVAEELTAEKQKRNLKKQVSIGKSRPDLFFSPFSFSFFFFSPFFLFCLSSLARSLGGTLVSGKLSRSTIILLSLCQVTGGVKPIFQHRVGK